jgi:hypothetical protein
MKRHSLDVLSLVFGLIFLLVAGSWIIRRNTTIELPGAGWFIAGALIVAGLFGIVSSLRGPRTKDTAAQELPTYPPATGYETPGYAQSESFYPTPTETPTGTPTETPTETPIDEAPTTETKPEDRGF